MVLLVLYVVIRAEVVFGRSETNKADRRKTRQKMPRPFSLRARPDSSCFLGVCLGITALFGFVLEPSVLFLFTCLFLALGILCLTTYLLARNKKVDFIAGVYIKLRIFLL